MAPGFSVLRSSSRRRENNPNFDSRYGDSGISAPNQGATWPEWSCSPGLQEPERHAAPLRHSPPVDNDIQKSSITITINLPWKSKSRSNSLPPTASRFRHEPAQQVPVESAPVISPKHLPAATLATVHSIPTRSSPRPLSPPFFQESARRSPNPQSPPYYQETARRSPHPQSPPYLQEHHRRSPKPQDLVARSFRQKPPTPLLGVLTPVSETFDDYPRHTSVANRIAMTRLPRHARHSPLPPSREFNDCYDASDEEAPEDHCYQPATHLPRSRSPAPELVRRSPLPDYHEQRRARSVEPSMYHRRRRSSISSISSSSSSSDGINSADDADSVADHGYYGPGYSSSAFNSPHASEFGIGKPAAPGPVVVANVYNKTATDYSMIIREVEADYQAARTTKSGKERPSDLTMSTPGSAGSGISAGSADSGYASVSGPQVLVPSGEDLWG